MRILSFWFFLLFSFVLVAQEARLVVPIGHSGMITCHAVSSDSDSRYLVTGGQDEKVVLWDRRSGKEIRSFGPLESDISQVAISPDNQFVLAGTEKGQVVLWEIEGGLRYQFTLDGYVTALVFSSDSKWFAAGNSNGACKAMDIPSPEDKTPSYTAFDGFKSIHSLSFSGSTKEYKLLIAGRFSAGKAATKNSNVGFRILTRNRNKQNKWERWTIGWPVPVGNSGLSRCQAHYTPDGSTILLQTGGGISLVDLNGQPMWEKEVFHGNRIPLYSEDGSSIYFLVLVELDIRVFEFDLQTGELLDSLSDTVSESSVLGLFPENKDDEKKHVMVFTIENEFRKYGNILEGKYVTYKFGYSLRDLEGEFEVYYGGNVPEVFKVDFWKDSKSVDMELGGKGTATWGLSGDPIELSEFGNPTSRLGTGRPPYHQLVLDYGSCGCLNDGQLLEVDTFPGIKFTQMRRSRLPVRNWYSIPLSRVSKSLGRKYLSKGEVPLYEKLKFRITGLYCSSSENVFASCHKNGKVFVWDLYLKANSLPPSQMPPDEPESVFREPGLELTGHRKPLSYVAFSPDKKYISGVEGSGKKAKCYLWDRSGNLIRKYKAHRGGASFCKFSEDGSMIVTSGKDGWIRYWDVSSNKLVKQFEGQEAWDVSRSPDGNLVVSCDHRRVTKLWQWEEGKELGSFFVLDSSDWAFIMPEGQFDASPPAMKLMHYVIGDDIVDLHQFEDRYYVPGLVERLISTEQGLVPEVVPLEESSLFPELKSRLNGHVVHVELEPKAGGGIGRTALYVNRRELEEDVNPKREKQFAVDLNKYKKYYYQDKKNRIELQVFNQEGTIEGPKSLHTYLPESDSDTLVSGYKKPHLYVITVGTSKYIGEDMALSFPDNDAARFSKAINQVSIGVFQDRIHITELSTSGRDGVLEPTRKNIAKAFSEVAKQAKPEDVFMVYFSGHGVPYGQADKTQFYYLTKDATSFDLSEEDLRNKRAIASDTLAVWHTNIAANKQILILDACNSGDVTSSFQDLLEKNAHFSEVKAIRRMNGKTGMFILAGSAADRSSFESGDLGHGLLTYSLLNGMNGGGLTNDRFVRVNLLFDHASEQVQALAKERNIVQRPVIDIPDDGTSIDIGYLQLGESVPVSTGKTVFKRPLILDASFGDELGIVKKLIEHFQLLHLSNTIYYVDSWEYAAENAYSLRGQYNVEEKEITLEAWVFKGGKKISECFEVPGTTNDLDDFVDKIIIEFEDRLNSDN